MVLTSFTLGQSLNELEMPIGAKLYQFFIKIWVVWMGRWFLG